MKGSYDAARMLITSQVLASILRNETQSYRQIAELHGVSEASVFRIAQANKVRRVRGRKVKK